MALPPDIPTTNVVCTFVAADGGEVKGFVTLRYDGYFVSNAYDSVVVPKSFTGELVNSTVTITVPKDDVTITYRVDEDFDVPVRRRGYYIDVNPSDTSIILADRAPTSIVKTGTAYLTETMLNQAIAPALDAAASAQASAAAAQTSAANALVVGEVRVDNLYLRDSQGDEINAGNVRGPKGDPGDLTPSVLGTAVSGSFTLTAANFPSTRNWVLAGNQTVVLPATNTMPADKAGTVTFVIKQPPTGGPYTMTWPAGLEWPNDALAPVMPTAANSELIVHLFWTGVAFRAFVGGVFFP